MAAPKVNGAGDAAGLLSPALPKLKGEEGAGLEAAAAVPKLKPATVGAGVDGLLVTAPNGLDAGAAGVVDAALLAAPKRLVGAGVLAVSFGAAAPNANLSGDGAVAPPLTAPNLKSVEALEELPKSIEAAV